MNLNLEVSIILPTLNESDNLKVIIPELVSELNKRKQINYEILIIDDGSKDNTHEVINNLIKDIENLQIYIRNEEKSLPLSILKGIELSKYEYVLWIDADGSMPAEDVGRLIDAQVENKNSVIVGSRFVEGGGYKGTVFNEDNQFRKAIKNVSKSKDSVIATVLSTIFNKILSLISSTGVKDMTSGFIIGKKINFHRRSFLSANYGDYFIFLVKDLSKKNIDIIEIGYKCQTRIHGVSKSGNSLKEIFILGLPYIKAAIRKWKLMKVLDSEKNLLAIFLKEEDIKPGRNFLTDDSQEMQLAGFNFTEKTTVENHIHNDIERNIKTTSEILTVISGEMVVNIFDSKLNFVHSEVLKTGDTVALFQGGHGIEIESKCKFIESKQGPYYPDLDKKRF